MSNLTEIVKATENNTSVLPVFNVF